jgi:hypothetical protein
MLPNKSQFSVVAPATIRVPSVSSIMPAPSVQRCFSSFSLGVSSSGQEGISWDHLYGGRRVTGAEERCMEPIRRLYGACTIPLVCQRGDLVGERAHFDMVRLSLTHPLQSIRETAKIPTALLQSVGGGIRIILGL